MIKQRLQKQIVDPETGEVLAETFQPTNEEIAAVHRAYEKANAVFFKTPNNFDRDYESQRTGCACPEPTKTQQHLAQENEMRNILEKFRLTGELTPTGIPMYLTIEGEPDLLEHIITQDQVDQAWNALPVEARSALKDPATFADYVHHCVERGDVQPLKDLGLGAPLPQAEPPQQATGGGAGTTPAAPPPAPPEPPPSGANVTGK